MVKGPSIDSSLRPASHSRKSSILHATTLIIGLLSVGLLISAGTAFFTNLKFQAPQFSNVVIGALIAYLITSLAMHNLGRFPGNRPLSYLLPAVTVSILLMIAVIILTRLEYS